MNRRHFRSIAEVLRAYGEQLDEHDVEAQNAWGHLCVEMGITLSRYNDKFSMSTWLQACTPVPAEHEEVA